MSTFATDPNLVNSRETFIAFVLALIQDRDHAAAIEIEHPNQYRSGGGAEGWQNQSISSFLEAALRGAEDQSDWALGSEPSWHDLAVFLYMGKIYE